jgi:hypothetical protein
MVSNPVRTLTLPQCKEYVRNIKELEVQCYQLARLHDHLHACLEAVQKQCRQNKVQEEKKAPKAPAPPKKSDVLWGALFGVFFGGIAGIAGALIGFICWLFSGQGFIYNFQNGMDAPLKPFLINGGLIPAGIVFLGCIILNWPSSKKKHDAKMEVYHKELAAYTDSQRAMQAADDTAVDQWTCAVKDCEKKQSDAAALLKRYYDMGFIYPKYRGLVPICTIYEYLDSGRCFSLLGHEGAYNLYESELRMNMIVTKLDDIADRLDDISDNQRLLATELQRSNKKIDVLSQSLTRSLDHIENNASLSAYYNQVTAVNTSYLAWLSYLDHK